MGKKSLTKSTTKKKKITGKKPSGQAADIAVESTKAPEAKTTAPEAKVAAPAPATAEKKKPAAKKPTIKTLLKKDFGAWVPAAMFSVSPDAASTGNYTAPPFIDDADPSQAETIRALLSKQFDLSIVEAPEAPQKPAATPKKKPPAAKSAKPSPGAPAEKPVEIKVEKKPLSIPELLNLKFESWQPEKLFTPVMDPAHQPVFSAPAFVDAENPEEASKIKALLIRQFDLSVVEVTETPAVTEPPEKIEIPAEEPAPAAEIVEPPVIEPVKTEEPPTPVPAKQPETPVPAPGPEKPPVVVETLKPVEKKAPEPVTAAPPKPVETPKKEENKEPEKPKAEIKKETPEAPIKPSPKPSVEKAPEPPAPIEHQAVVNQPEAISGPIKMLIACFAGIFGLLIIASAINTTNYYLKPADNAVEIWQGTFSPKGQKMIMSVPGAVIPEPVQTVYAKKQALVPAFDYYIKKADALIKTKGQTDFEAIRSTLYKAIQFAPTVLHQNDAKSRFHKIDCMLLIDKADVAAGKGTLEGYQAATIGLNQVKALGLEEPQKTLVEEKLDTYNKAKALLIKEYAVPEKYTVPVKKHPAEPKPH